MWQQQMIYVDVSGNRTHTDTNVATYMYHVKYKHIWDKIGHFMGLVFVYNRTIPML